MKKYETFLKQQLWGGHLWNPSYFVATVSENTEEQIRKYIQQQKEKWVAMEKAYKFRIYPNKTQEILIQKTFGCVRFVYNHFLDKRIKAYEADKTSQYICQIIV